MSTTTVPALRPDGIDANARLLDRAPRLALAVFVVAQVGALGLYLWAGREQWFFNDEWDFLVNRSLGDPESLMRAHFEHWTTLPVVAYRVLWQVFGLRTYVPYQLLSIGAHLVLAALMRVVMRRAGVGPWLATIVGCVILFFGAGHDDIIWGFQITFTGGVIFGVIHLLLLDHDGPLDRRDWLGLLAGLLGLMCAAPGLLMVGVAGLAALARRGWRAALFHTAPLLTTYFIWSAFYSERRFDSPDGLPPLGVWGRFVERGITGTFDAISQVSYVGWMLAILLVGGLLLGFREMGLREFTKRAAMPVALLFGAGLFLVLTGYGRSGFYGAERARESRYFYMVAVMALPAVGLAAEAVVRRWRYAAPVVIALLLVGIPGNVAASDDRDPVLRGDRGFVLALPAQDVARVAPGDVRPGGFFAPDLTIGWLVDGADSGRVPTPSHINERLASRARLAVSLVQRQGVAAPSGPCPELGTSVPRRLEAGQQIAFRGGDLRLVEMQGGRREGVAFNPLAGSIDVVAGPLDVVLEPADPTKPVSLCN